MALGLLVGLAGDANAQPTYSFTTFDVPGSTGTTQAFGINDSGQIVGYYQADDSTSHGFLLDNGSYTTFDAPGHIIGWADLIPFPGGRIGINNSGQIVGAYGDASGVVHGFLLDQGSYTTLDVPGAQYTFANGINASGQIVGYYWDAFPPATIHGFLLDQGNYSTLDMPSWNDTFPTGINDSRQIVGSLGNDPLGDWYSFLGDSGNYTMLDVQALVFGINNAGQIVGAYIGGSTIHGFLFDQGGYTTLDVPGASYTSAQGINDSGQIVGAYTDAGGTHGFLATPVP
jgi:probable HAF family extracellular repeat protein